VTEQTRIRAAHRSDIEALAVLAAQTFREAFAGDNAPDDINSYVSEAFSAERLRSEFADARNQFVLAFLGEREAPVGYAKLRMGRADASVQGPDPIELERLYVLRSALGRGIGAALMRACLDAASRGGHRTLWLGVWERNARAIAFYERWGFEVVGDHAFHLGSDEQTDLIMERAVDATD
jgi:diamine N-acetyltransferase